MNFSYHDLTLSPKHYPIIDQIGLVTVISGTLSPSYEFRFSDEQDIDRNVLTVQSGQFSGLSSMTIHKDDQLFLIEAIGNNIRTGMFINSIKATDTQNISSEMYFPVLVLPSPSGFGNIVRWYDASSLDYAHNQSVGAVVRPFKDKSINLDHLYSTSTTIFPTFKMNQFSYLPAVNWSGNQTGVGLTGLGTTITGQFTVFTVYYPISTGNNKFYSQDGGELYGMSYLGDRNFTAFSETTWEIRNDRHDTTTTSLATTWGFPSNPADKVNIFASAHSGMTPYFDISASSYTTSLVQGHTTGDSATIALTGIFNTIGYLPNETSINKIWSGYIGEVVIYDKAFTLSEQENMINYYFKPRWLGINPF